MNDEWFDSRADKRAAFLERCGWAQAQAAPVGADCAFRRYQRLHRDGQSAILMEGMPDHDQRATPGHKIHDFIRISRFLRDHGLAAPAIYDSDEHAGYLLLEDFGDISFKTALLEKKLPAPALYELATDILKHMRDLTVPADMVLPHYYQSHVHEGRRRLVDWYIPSMTGRQNPDGLVEEYLAVWDEIESGLPPVPQGFLHIDYHFENLMWRAGRAGLAQAGILDFQGAMFGPAPYDLANVLEDARVDVPEDLRRAMIERFCADMKPDEKDVFMSWYRVLATQFHCRVAGQFIKLALTADKPRYLDHLPRVQGYIEKALAEPVLAPLQKFLADYHVVFNAAPALKASLIRTDAF